MGLFIVALILMGAGIITRREQEIKFNVEERLVTNHKGLVPYHVTRKELNKLFNAN